MNHSRRSAVEGPLSKERRSSEARRRRASLLVPIIIIYNVDKIQTYYYATQAMNTIDQHLGQDDLIG